MNVLVIGNGAREHTLTWKIAQSPKVTNLFCAPGNAGTAAIAENLPLSPTDIPAVVRTARDKHIDLGVVGPEAPLVAGIVDALAQAGIPSFGPKSEAAIIEGSKVFAKELMFKHGIPAARSATFQSFDDAARYVQTQSYPLVIKADGLAAGKGVIIAGSVTEAQQALSDIMQKRAFGPAGARVLVEECLVGRETSLMAFTDGQTVIDMIPACDYKRALDGDRGLNTGGMGSYSPSEFVTAEFRERVMSAVLEPTVRAMAAEGRPYRGILYAGLMVTSEGPKVLEFNARFGDPETQVILPLLQTDLVDVMQTTIDGTLGRTPVEWSDEACVGVVLASDGYPAKYQTGFPIEGLDEVEEDILVFHAGTRSDNQGRVLTDGGRVLTVVATAPTHEAARQKVYRNLERVRFEGCHYRRDIGIIKR